MFVFLNVVGLKSSVVTNCLQTINSVSESNWWELVQCVGRITSLMKKRVTVLGIAAASSINDQSVILYYSRKYLRSALTLTTSNLVFGNTIFLVGGRGEM